MPATFATPLYGEECFGQQTLLSFSFIETLGMSDSRTAITTYARTLTELTGVVDSRDTGFAFTEAMGLTDTTVLLYGRNPAETMGVTDNATSVVTYIRVFAETMGLTDSIIAELAREFRVAH